MELNTRPKVRINLAPGLYVFDPLSATGKTYLASILTKLTNLREPVVAYTYDDYLKGVDPELRLAGRPWKVILLDRFDMYSDDPRVLEAIQQIDAEAIVLVDAKANQLPPIGSYRSAYIELMPEVIEVTL